MTPADRALAESIVGADRLFVLGQFEASYDTARALLEEVSDVAGERAPQWRAELLGLIGRNALQLYRLDEALTSTRQAIHALHVLQDDALYPLLEVVRENLLTILAALEPPDGHSDEAPAPGHRHTRCQILHAQACTDRYRFAQSIEGLEPLLRGLQSLGPLPSDGAPPAEPADPRLWYLPRVLGLLGFNWFHRGDLERAKALTGESIEASRALGDRTGERVYRASLASIERGHRNPEPAGG